MQTTSEQKQNNIYNNLGGINMFKQMKKRIKNEKGLTLIELLAVVVILAIIAAIAIPAIGNIINNSRDKAILSEASNILSGAKIAYTDNACGDDNTCDNTELADYVDGITLGTGDSASYNPTTKEWTITFSRLSEIKQEKFKENIDSNAVSESNLNTNLKK